VQQVLVLGLAIAAGRQAHCKHRTFAHLARHDHIAAHHARELAREGKAEPRSTGIVSLAVQRLGRCRYPRYEFGYCIVARVYSTFSASSVASSAVSPRLSAASSGLTQFLP
jgi:hypothetical protein